jgi:hypothetical protein
MSGHPHRMRSRPDLLRVGTRSFPHPTAFQISFSPCSVNCTRRKPSLQTRPQKPPGNSPRVCPYGANIRAICLRRQEGPPTRLLRGECPPRRIPRAEVGYYRFAAKELRPQTRSRIVLWPPSRQGYFAPASRDAILLDGSLPATISPALTLFLHISSGTKVTRLSLLS